MHDDEVTYRIRHTTSYAYSDVVTLAHNEARLGPRNGPWQVAHTARLVVDPTPAFMTREHDYFGNWVNLFVLQEPHRRFMVTAHSEVTVREPFLPDPEDTTPWEEVREMLDSSIEQEVFEAVEHRFESPHVRWTHAVRDYAAASFTPGRPILAAALDLSQRIHRDFEYRPGVTNVATPVRAVFEQRRGVCQDFAHLMIAGLRSMGLSARYVSGYLLTQPAEGPAAAHRLRREPCVGGGLLSGPRFHRHRSDQRHLGEGRASDVGVGPRLRRCESTQRCRARWGSPYGGRGGRSGASRRRRSR